jgi:hypothetical protein
MKVTRLLLNLGGLAVIVLAGSTLANAQATRTWVSGVGDDVNPCSRTAPCKTFAGAISKTAANGEINCLDPGGFGAVTITKSITIDGGGTFASILAAGTNGVIINAAASDKIILRNLSIHGAGTGLNGIRFLAGSQLTVENCVIFGFTTNGIDVNKTASGNVYVKDTNITKCSTGINLTTTSGNIVANVEHVRLEGMANGVVAGTNAFANVRDSSVFQNTGNGIQANANGIAVNVENCMIAHNGTGVNASASGSTIRLNNNNILGNGTSIAIAGGATVASFGTNTIAGNGGGVLPNSTPVRQ